MNINKLLEFIKCPYCANGALILETDSLVCTGCRNIFQIIDGVPVLLKKENLSGQEKSQAGWFDGHYSEFPKEEYKLENWRLSMLNRIFEPGFKGSVKTYLDIGCGATGYTVIEAVRRNNWLSFGIDISIEAMAKARHLAEKEGVGQSAAFLVCSAENLPFRAGSIDYISAVSLLEHLENDEKTIKDLRSVLRGSGYLYVCVPNTYRRMWPFLWPVYYYFDRKIGHKRHYSIEALAGKMRKDNCFQLEDYFYNGHLIKFYQIILDKIRLIGEEKWWHMEKKDINKVPSGVQLNAIFRKR